MGHLGLREAIGRFLKLLSLSVSTNSQLLQFYMWNLSKYEGSLMQPLALLIGISYRLSVVLTAGTGACSCQGDLPRGGASVI
jgi:hypothetical protein